MGRSSPAFSSPAVKIELEDDGPTNPRATFGQHRHRDSHSDSSSFFEPKTLIKWILIIAIGGPLLQWLFSLISRQ
jgi:hypothetical protein